MIYDMTINEIQVKWETFTLDKGLSIYTKRWYSCLKGMVNIRYIHCNTIIHFNSMWKLGKIRYTTRYGFGFKMKETISFICPYEYWSLIPVYMSWSFSLGVSILFFDVDF